MGETPQKKMKILTYGSTSILRETAAFSKVFLRDPVHNTFKFHDIALAIVKEPARIPQGGSRPIDTLGRPAPKKYDRRARHISKPVYFAERTNHGSRSVIPCTVCTWPLN
jgi:hypothetical protein